MDIKRREKNKLNIDKKQLEIYIERDKDSIPKLKNSGLNSEFVLNKIELIKEKNKEREMQLIEINEKLILLENGDLDDEIKLQQQLEQKISENKHKEKLNIKENKKKEKEIDTQKSKQFIKSMKSENQLLGQKRRDMKYGLKDFYRSVDSLPSYMITNLNTMTYNKGYIWKGTQFYGKIPENNPNENIILFEKPGRDILRIHEISLYDHKIYDKYGKNRKQLVQTILQKKHKNISLMDYVKN
jgi:hypothetical protein